MNMGRIHYSRILKLELMERVHKYGNHCEYYRCDS